LLEVGPRTATHCAAVVDATPSAWRDAAGFSTYGLRVTAAELETIGRALDAVLRPYIGATRDESPADAEAVHVALQVFRRIDPS
jgi:hypothetical protein